MRRRVLLVTVPSVFAGPALPQEQPAVTAEQGWSRPALARIGTAVAYLNLRNGGSRPVRLVGGSTSVAEAVEIHESIIENGVARMHPLPGGVVVPQGETVRFEPGGMHLMLMRPHADFKAGQGFTLTLRFDDGGTLTVPIQVTMRQPTAGHGGAAH